MTTTKGRAPGCPPGYDAREQALWAQIQGLHQHTGRLDERIRKLEEMLARLLAQYREMRGVLEHWMVKAPWPAPPPDPAPPDQAGGDLPAPAEVPAEGPPPRRKKGGAG